MAHPAHHEANLDVSKLTLEEIEAIASRLEAAARVFREARAMLGPAPAVVQPPSVPSHAQMDADMRAQREALLARNREVLPDAIKAAEGMS